MDVDKPQGSVYLTFKKTPDYSLAFLLMFIFFRFFL